METFLEIFSDRCCDTVRSLEQVDNYKAKGPAIRSKKQIWKLGSSPADRHT